jgi:hypothetical protein
MLVGKAATECHQPLLYRKSAHHYAGLKSATHHGIERFFCTTLFGRRTNPFVVFQVGESGLTKGREPERVGGTTDLNGAAISCTLLDDGNPVGRPAPVEAERHTNRQTDRRGRLTGEGLGIKDDDIAKVASSPIQNDAYLQDAAPRDLASSWRLKVNVEHWDR